MISVTVDGIKASFAAGTTVLEAAQQSGAVIPTLCHLKEVNDVGACRICVVEIEGANHLAPACCTPVQDGMVVMTDSPRIRRARKVNLEFLLARHHTSCTTCVRNGNCSLQSLAKSFGIVSTSFPVQQTMVPWPQDAPLIRDSGKCVQCMRCVAVCDKVQGVHVWRLVGNGSQATVSLLGTNDIRETQCTYCGQCILHCPTGALRERDDTAKVLRALADPKTVVVAQMAPAVRTAWAEQLGISREAAPAELLVSALKRMGFDHVFDTTFSADLTVMEESNELIARLTKKGGRGSEGDNLELARTKPQADDPQAEADPKERPSGLPLFTSCCAGWYRFAKVHYPQLVPHLSTVKSPQQMFGAIMKGYFAKSMDVDPESICCVSLMPCVSKKFECFVEASGKEDGAPDVDVVLTTRELVRLLGACSIDVSTLSPRPFDTPLGTASGAGMIFGTTGGVMEAALRTAYFITNGHNPEPNAFRYALTDAGSWKEGSYQLGEHDVRVAVAHGLRSVRALVDSLLAGTATYDFVEIMACPDGCIGGGGQPIAKDPRALEGRKKNLCDLDIDSDLRFAHENPVIKECYRNCLGLPLSEQAEKLLHIETLSEEQQGGSECQMEKVLP